MSQNKIQQAKQLYQESLDKKAQEKNKKDWDKYNRYLEKQKENDVKRNEEYTHYLNNLQSRAPLLNTIDIVQTIFDTCCDMPDEKFCDVIKDTGNTDNIILYSFMYIPPTYKFSIWTAQAYNYTSAYSGQYESGITSCNTIDAFKEYDLSYWDIHDAFKNKTEQNKELPMRILSNRVDSEFNGWTVHVTSNKDKQFEWYKIILSRNKPRNYLRNVMRCMSCALCLNFVYDPDHDKKIN